MLAGMSGVPRVCGTHTIAICGCGSSSAFVSTGGSPSRCSAASIVRDRAAAQDQRRAPPGLLERLGRVRRAARAAALVERGVAVVGLVHLGHQADVGRLTVLGDAPVEVDEVAVAVAAGDPARRDHLARAVAVLGRDVQHQPRARALGAAEDELVGAEELREEAEHRRVVAGLALEEVGRLAAASCPRRPCRAAAAAGRPTRRGRARARGRPRDEQGGASACPDHRQPPPRAATAIRR